MKKKSLSIYYKNINKGRACGASADASLQSELNPRLRKHTIKQRAADAYYRTALALAPTLLKSFTKPGYDFETQPISLITAPVFKPKTQNAMAKR